MRSTAAVIGVTITGLIILAVASGPLKAAPQATSNVAVVDNNRVFAESTPGKNASQQITASGNNLQTQITQTQNELQTLLDQRQQQAGVMTDEARMQLENDIQDKQIQLQRQRDDAERQYSSTRDRVLADFETRVTPVLASLADELGYPVVLNSQAPGLLYYSTTIDITDQFIARLNAMDDR